MIPLWHVCWAAPGKDESWSPMSLVEKIAATSGFRQADFDADLSSTVPLKAAEVLKTLREAIEQAREVFRRLPAESAGKLFVDDKGERRGQDPFRQREHRRGYEGRLVAVLARHRQRPGRAHNRCLRLGGRWRAELRPLFQEVEGPGQERGPRRL